MSNVILLLCLFAGFIIGFKDIIKLPAKAYSILLNITVFFLLFIMGANLGFRPNLGASLVKYGISGGVIAFLAMFFGCVAVIVLLKIFNKTTKQ